MSIEQQHPLYIDAFGDWVVMRDTAAGQKTIKQKQQTYLPATEGQVADGMSVHSRGYKSYKSYLLRSLFPDFVSEAIEAALGVMHRKPPNIRLPAAMEPLRNKATTKGESLEQLLLRINEEQLAVGRIGLLGDVAVDPAAPADALPYIATYVAEAIINWDDGRREEITLQNLNLVVLNESEPERQVDFSWETEQKFRVLILGQPEVNEGVFTAGEYRVAVVREDGGLEFDFNDTTAPMVRGKTLEKIPFVFVNSQDLLPKPDKPRLLGLANLSLAVYRADADYRQNLFMQGQDTFVIIGTVMGSPDTDGADSGETRVGAGATLNLDQGGSAGYEGVNSDGLSEQRESLENDKGQAILLTGNLMDTKSRDRESGDAMRIRRGSQTATLTNIALTGAKGLEDILKILAEWMGADPNEVVVTPNMDFNAETLSGKEATDLQTAKMIGFPLSQQTLHDIARERGLTTLTHEEELGLIESEEPLIDTTGGEDRGVEESNPES